MDIKVNSTTPAFQAKFIRNFSTKLKGDKDLTIRCGAKDIEYLISKNNKMIDASGFHKPDGFNVLEVMDIFSQFKSMAKDGKEFMDEFFNALMKKPQ